ncbi:MAG: LysR family transcriptional regulator [Myxococcaceae bacterium]|nr:LysR family transcriptional regulator [Myxococcaceae bacterium]MCI0673689.1 LysR family transcriptional regulator [Myxococcaceae bacterium]
MLDWNDLRFAIAVQRAGTMAGAARALGVEHTTVLRRLAALEHSLGMRVFERTPSGVRLTPAGTAVLSAAERVERGVCEVERAAAAQEHDEAPVRVATSDVFATYFLAGRLADFRARWPRAELSVIAEQRTVDLQRLEAEVAIRMATRDDFPPGEPGLVARKLGQVAWALYGSPHLLQRCGVAQGADPAGSARVVYDGSVPAPPWPTETSAGATVALRSSSVPVVRAAVEGGVGLGVLPCFVGDAGTPLVRLGEPVGWSTLWLVVHPDLQAAPRVRRVMDFVADVVTHDAGILRGEGGAATFDTAHVHPWVQDRREPTTVRR